MQKFEFTMEIQLDDDQMNIVQEAYEKAKADGFSCPIECYVESLADIGIGMTLLRLARAEILA